MKHTILPEVTELLKESGEDNDYKPNSKFRDLLRDAKDLRKEVNQIKLLLENFIETVEDGTDDKSALVIIVSVASDLRNAAGKAKYLDRQANYEYRQPL